MTPTIEAKTKELIDDLKSTCANYGLGNDGNEYKIITQIFLYKFINDKFGYEVKNLDSPYKKRINSAENWEEGLSKLTEEEYEDLISFTLPADSPKLMPQHFISTIWNQQGKGDFATLLDATLVDIGNFNTAIFSVKTANETSVTLFENITTYIPDTAQRDDFARALVSRLVNFNFEQTFGQKHDFYAVIFEYLIKDYNKDGGGKYAEYYTPHSVARIMAQLMVRQGEDVKSVTCYDPSAGSGTLLMAIAHAIGADRCTIYSQDISQKSSKMLRLNLILNNLVHSIHNIIQGDTLVSPYHTNDDGTLRNFDYIVSNPPFKLDFSDTQSKLTSCGRFWAGVPKVPNKDKSKMSIYLCFLQHIINSLSDKGKAAIVVPTGFITAKNGIEFKIREKLVKDKILRGVVSMPSNIFATTGTNVSILFIDKANKTDKAVFIDASKLGEEYKDGSNQRTRLRDFEEQNIVDAFHNAEPIDGFSVTPSFSEIKEKGYSFSAGQYFDIKIEYIEITADEFEQKMADHKRNLKALFEESSSLETEIMKQLEGLKYE
ncbi:HsdM family class I SAM-dependent methyltransferase [Bacteroides sp.]|uniref:HsdM family class I SAM-dependent methyltransferase n=1 Tax=Bacteroides sp. TaxID=29523 RepID=UPI004026595D